MEEDGEGDLEDVGEDELCGLEVWWLVICGKRDGGTYAWPGDVGVDLVLRHGTIAA